MHKGRLSKGIASSRAKKELHVWKKIYNKKRINNPPMVLELAAGERGRKVVELALAHPKTQFVAIDHLNVDYKGYLQSKGVKRVPSNLKVIEHRDALQQLLRSKPNFFDHVYTHFLLQHLSYAQRTSICQELLRVLKPGAKFVTVEQYHVSRQIPLELRKAGFKVTVKPMSVQQLFKLGTDCGDLNAQRATLTERRIAAARAYGGREAEEAEKQVMINGGRWQMMNTANVNGDLKTIEGRKALERIMQDEERQFTHSHFYVITATKPRSSRFASASGEIIIPTKEEVKKHK